MNGGGEDEGARRHQRTLDWRRVQDEVAKLRRMQEDLLIASAEDEGEAGGLDEAEMREINDEINRKMDALLRLMERYNADTSSTSSPSLCHSSSSSSSSSPKRTTDVPTLTVSSPVELTHTHRAYNPRGEDEELKQLERRLQRWHGVVVPPPRPASPGAAARKRLALPQLYDPPPPEAKSESEATAERKSESDAAKSFGGKAKQAMADCSGSSNSGSGSGEIHIPVLGPEDEGWVESDEGEETKAAVEVVTIKKWMTRKRSNRSLLGTTSDNKTEPLSESEEVLSLFTSPTAGRRQSSRDHVVDNREESSDDLLFDVGKGMERSGSADAMIEHARKLEAVGVLQRTKSEDSAERAAVDDAALWRKHMERIGNRLDVRRASDGNLTTSRGRRRRRNTDGVMLSASVSTATDDDDSSVDDSSGSEAGLRSSVFRLRRRRGSLGGEATASENDTEGDEEWHDMLGSLGVTMMATKKLLKKKAKERKAKKERKRRSGELREVENLWGSTSGSPREDLQLEDQNWIVFVNRNSGGKLGQRVMNRFLELLPHDQVFSLIDDKGPGRGFERWLKTPHYQLVVCGGDGTANWVLTALDKLATEHALAKKPPVGIIPLGTGNDLSRACGWGSSFTRCEKLPKVMRTMSRSSSALFDRWQLSVTLLEEEAEQRNAELATDGTQEDHEEQHEPPPRGNPLRGRSLTEPPRRPPRPGVDDSGNQAEEASIDEKTEDSYDLEDESVMHRTAEEESSDRSEIGHDEQMLRDGMRAEPGEMEYIMNNYFSIGVDAEIVLRFHRMREHHKELFRNVLINKGWYYGMSARTAKNERKHFKNFRDHVQIKVWRGDQHELLRINDKKIKSLIVMNIPTYGGARCWGREDSLHSNVYHLAHKRTSAFSYVPPAIGDGILEIVGMRGVAHLGAIVTGVSEAVKLAQGTRVEIVTKKEFPAHVDGEPWLLRPCRIIIEMLNQSCLLVHPERRSKLL